MKVMKLDKKHLFLYFIFTFLLSIFTKMVIGVIALNVSNVLKIESWHVDSMQYNTHTWPLIRDGEPGISRQEHNKRLFLCLCSDMPHGSGTEQFL